MKVGDTVEVKPTWCSKFYDRYWGYDLHGEKGEITEVLSRNGEIEYYRVKFPTITIWDQDNPECQFLNPNHPTHAPIFSLHHRTAAHHRPMPAAYKVCNYRRIGTRRG